MKFNLLWPYGLFLCFMFMANSVFAEEEIKSVNQAYHVESGDVLRITVWDEPELQSEVIVLPDETISFPLVGVIDVANKSIVDITDLITKKLKKFIPEAHVNVSLHQVRGSKFFVLGKVNRPGEFPLEGDTRVLQALSVAGGLTTFADADEIKVIRESNNEQRSIKVNYPSLVKGKNLENNIRIESGDVVVVP